MNTAVVVFFLAQLGGAGHGLDDEDAEGRESDADQGQRNWKWEREHIVRAVRERDAFICEAVELSPLSQNAKW